MVNNDDDDGCGVCLKYEYEGIDREKEMGLCLFVG